MPHSYLWFEAYSLSSYAYVEEIKNIGKDYCSSAGHCKHNNRNRDDVD